MDGHTVEVLGFIRSSAQYLRVSLYDLWEIFYWRLNISQRQHTKCNIPLDIWSLLVPHVYQNFRQDPTTTTHPIRTAAEPILYVFMLHEIISRQSFFFLALAFLLALFPTVTTNICIKKCIHFPPSYSFVVGIKYICRWW